MIDEKKLIEDILSLSKDITSEWETAGILNLIYKQPKVGEWIPCSERLPEEETEVIVTREFLGTKGVPKRRYVEVAGHIGGGWYSFSDEYKYCSSKHTNPIAWMPLPEPYKGE